MRWRVLVATLLLVSGAAAGCTGKEPGADPAAPGPAAPSTEPSLVDNLTARLHPDSGAFFPDLWIEDRIDFPDGGNMTLALGLGVRCEGNATSLAPANSTGVVSCMLRLASDANALVVSTRQLELGFDYQPLTRRTPAEPVEWRVVVEVLAKDPATNVSVLQAVHDSGWRSVDLSPRVTAPTVAIRVDQPCDLPDEVETNPGLRKTGLVVLNVSFTVLSHAQATLAFDVPGSVLGTPGGWPPAEVEISEHALMATYPSWGSEQPMLLSVPVDLETDALPGSAQPTDGPCDAVVAHEAQVWTITLSYVGADGRGGQHVLAVPYDVYVGAVLV